MQRAVILVLLMMGAGSAVAQQATREEGIRAFTTIQQVLQHPRCQNCHIPGDAPLQLDEGRTHTQGVQRGADGKGVPAMNCATCHGAANLSASYGRNVPPGAPNWHLPPAHQKMVFIGLDASQLCSTIKDPQRNGGKSMDQLFEHISHDKLVLWGWDPGLGRKPVDIAHADFVAAFRSWMQAGAPCP
ncbi:MAG TPA: hypothetical protein VIT67_13205 [Povalibacter sp.]